jgi:hypothetical protein
MAESEGNQCSLVTARLDRRGDDRGVPCWFCLLESVTRRSKIEEAGGLLFLSRRQYQTEAAPVLECARG